MKIEEVTIEILAKKVDELINFQNSIRESMLQLNDRWTAIVKHNERSIMGMSQRIDKVERLEETIKGLLCQLQQN